MRFSLPYADRVLNASLEGGVCLNTLDIADVPAVPDPGRAVRESLRRPIGIDGDLFAGILSGKRVALVVSDSFRQTRADEVVPVLLEGLIEAGTLEEDIVIVFSTGTHRAPNPKEQTHILGDDVIDRYAERIHVHDPRDEANLVYVGTTTRGTRVEINRVIHECDHVIATGAVVFHYFGGFGGGRKSIVPGLASYKTIAQNHSLNLDPDSDRLDPKVRIGSLDGNPVAEDMLEATKFTHVDFIVNTVLNKDEKIAAVFAGDLEEAHREAAGFARKVFAVGIRERASIVVAASPKTKNFVQTHKALFNAHLALKPGGRIVLIAPCPEGLGGEQFTKWLGLGSRGAIIAALRKQSDINGQTALSSLEKGAVTTMVTELRKADVETLGARKAETLQDAIDDAVARLSPSLREHPDFYLMPSAAHTVPLLED